MSNDVIKVINVTKRFGKKTVLDDVNLDIMSGEIFGIIGMSGSGKTTLLNTIIGFLQPEGGDVMFKLEHLLSFSNDERQFRSVFSSENDVKKSFGFAAQTPSIYAKLTCFENMEYFGHLYNLSHDVRRTNIEILLKLMGIHDSKHVQAINLSGGMLKRLDIACALIHDPKILILDEPTADLDPLLRKQMWKLIKQINEKGTTIILSSHFLDELELLCDRVGILLNGHIIMAGTPDQIKCHFTNDQEIKLETTPGKYKEIIEKLNHTGKNLSISSMDVVDNKLVIYTSAPERSLHQVLHIVEEMDEILLDVTVEKPSLQEVLEKLKLEK
ncbi:ABC transporter ATP-binding protein [Candidatus Woesearchaeota archaeon]|nr:ABC transporter ATP-binding protein [Candidatus Woesearchaeota archaeon]